MGKERAEGGDGVQVGSARLKREAQGDGMGKEGGTHKAKIS